jgi:hypothetical protein
MFKQRLINEEENLFGAFRMFLKHLALTLSCNKLRIYLFSKMLKIVKEPIERIFHIEKLMFLIRLIEVVSEDGDIFSSLILEFGLMYEFLEFFFHERYR